MSLHWGIWPWSELKRLRLQVETQKMQMAAIDVAADGNLRHCRADWQSPVLWKVLALRAKAIESDAK